MEIVGWAGLALLAWRLFGRSRAAARRPRDATWPSVSIVVPARNEAATLPRLLPTLKALAYEGPVEIVVVDDHSEDATYDVATAHGVVVVRAGDRPPGWMGKQWACQEGAKAARGELLLFTDADTAHRADSLARAVARRGETGAGLLSVLPYHDGTSWWERLTGPFHLLLLASCAPYAAPRPGRVFAIGQYLLFTRACYERLGGHASVKERFVEDLPLANRCLELGETYALMTDTPGAPLFTVRMYATLGEFVRGWRRNFRAGLGGSSWLLPVEMVAFVAAITGGGKFFATGTSAALYAATAVALGMAQQKLGRFSWTGALLGPIALALFCWVSALAAFDMAAKRPLRWKGRAYGRA